MRLTEVVRQIRARWNNEAASQALAPPARRAKRRERRSLLLEPLEPRVLLAANPFYTAAGAAAGVSLSLQVQDRNGVQMLELTDATSNALLQSAAVSSLTGPIDIIGSNFDDSLTINVNGHVLPQSVLFEGGAGIVTLGNELLNSSLTVTAADGIKAAPGATIVSGGDVTLQVTNITDLNWAAGLVGFKDKGSAASIDITGASISAANINLGTLASTTKLANVNKDLAQDTRAVVTGDFNGDGKLDLVQANFDGTTLLFLNNGTATPFDGTPSQIIGRNPVGGALTPNATSLAVGDVNKDGKLDLLLGVSGGPSLLFLNGGSATTPFDGVTAINVGTGTDNTAAVALADLNGDGRIDAVLGNSGSVSRYFMNDGTATPFKGAGTALNANPDKVTSIAIGDVDGDALPDVVLGTNGSGTLVILNNTSSTPFVATSPVAKIGALTDITTAVALADVNGDGRLDLVVANAGQATHLYANLGPSANPFSGAAQSIGSAADAVTSIALANVAGSARADLILGSATNPSQLFINNDSATPFSGVSTLIGANDTLQPVGSMAVGDVNGDGKLDLVLGNDNDLSKAYLNTGTATPFVDASVSLVNPDSSLIQRVGESALFDFNAFGAVVLATAKSTINLGTGTTLTSTGNISIDAEALGNASNTTIGLILGVTYADVESTASVTMQSGATLIASGSVSLQGNTTNVLSASTTVVAPTLIGLSVSYGKLRTHATADVQEGASVSGSNVSISAHNTNQVNTSASSFNLAGGQAGGAVSAGVGVAIGDYASDATAAIHGSASSAGRLTVDAQSIDTQDITSASASVINPPTQVKGLPAALNGPITTAFNPKLDGVRGFLGQALSAGGTSKLGVGAGVAYVNSSHAATALLGSHAVVKSLADATVNARAEDNFRAYATGSAGDSETAAIGGGVAVSTITNSANATVADGAKVDVEGVFHVVADAVVPNPVQSTLPALQFTPPTDNTNTPNSSPADRIANGFTYGQQASDGVGNILTNGVKPFVLGILTGDAKAVGTTFVQGAASPKAGAKAGVSGAVNVINVANTAIASIGKDARINQNTNHGPGQDVWVEALTTLITIDLAGMASVLSLKDLATGTPTASAGVGGNFDYIGYSNTASAYIDDRAVVSAGRDVKVTANSLNYLMTVVAQGTKGTSVGVTGAIAFADVTNNTLAHIEDGARVNATHDVVVAAGSTLSMFNADGALGIGAAAGVGLGLSVNLVRADNTLAFIGDNNGVTTTVGAVQAGHDLNVQAHAQEQLWSIAAAGAVATGQSQDPPARQDLSKAITAGITPQQITDSLKEKQFGFGISGAVGLNKLAGSTEAFIRMPGSVTVANALTVNADDQSLFVQGTGAFGIGKEAGIGGSASVTDIDKQTWAFIDNAIVKAGTLSVTANAGEQFVSVAAGAAGGKDSAAVAGSVSLNLVHSDTDAWLGASAGAGPSVRFAINGDALVQAQHTMNAISVAGAVSVGLKTTAAVGAALDFDIVDTHVNAYVDSNAALTTQNGNVRIFAANSEVSRGVAAALAISAQDGVGASGTVSGSILTDEVHAYTLSNVGAFGNVRIDADDNTDRVVVAGGAAGGKDAGVGLTVAAATIGRDVKAWVGDGVLLGTSGASTPIGDPQGSGFGGAGLTLDATSEDSLLIFAAGGAGGSNAGVAVTATIDLVTGDTEAWIGSSAKITGAKVGLFDPASVQIRAHDDRTVVAVAGAVAGGQKAGVGAALVVETINTVTQAHINASATVNAAGNVILDASVAEANTSVAAGFAGGGNGGGAGSAVGIGRTTNIQAFAGDSTKITAGGSVALGADDDFSVVPVAGAGGFGGTGGIAASNVTLVDTATTKAFLGVLATVTVQGNGAAVSVASGQRDANGRKIASLLNGLSITATEHQKLRPVTVGGAGGGTAGVAGSATVLVLNDTTQASIGSGAVVNSSQQISLLAADDTDSISAAGGLAGGGTAGIGAGADVGTITKNTQAFIAAPNAVANAPRVTAGGDVLLRALSSENILSVSGAAGIGGSLGLAGAAGVYVLNDTTYADVGFGASVTANGNVLVSADDESQLMMVAGSLSGSGTVGVGAAAGVSTLSKDTQAFISNGATVIANAKTPAITIENGQFNTVGGYFTPSARVNATTDAITFATPSGFADGQAVTYRSGGGGSIGNLVDGNTYYVIRVDANTFKLASSLANWQAGKAIDLTLTGTTGSQHSLLPAGSIALPTVTNTDLVQGDTGRLPTLLGRRSLSPQTESFSGVAVTAINKEAIETYAVSAGGAGAVAVSVAGAVAVTSANTLATIGAGASVTSGHNVKVVAGENLFHIGVGGTAAVAGTVAVTPGVDVTVAKNTTNATVGAGATIKALDVAVAARGEENLLSISIGLSGSGTAALSGAVSVLTVDDHVIASLGNATNIAADGNVSVTAKDNTANGIIAGAAAIGGAGGGFGASVAVTQINKDTEAFIGANAVISARGLSAATLTAFDPNSAVVTSNAAVNKSFTGLQVAADSNENLFAVGVAGAGGAIGGIAGAVSAELISASTLASVGSNTQINPSLVGASATQSIFITATNTVTVFGADGAVAGGAIGGLAGGVDVDIIRNNTATTIGTGVAMGAQQDVEVDAVATRAITSYAASGAAGAVGIAGGVSVISIGAALDSNAQSSLKPNDSGNTATTGGFLDGQAKSTPISNLLGGFTAPSGSSDNTQRLATTVGKAISTITAAGPAASPSAILGGGAAAGTSAQIGNQVTVTSGRDLTVFARELDAVTAQRVGAVGVGVVGIGGAVGVVSVASPVTASLGTGKAGAGTAAVIGVGRNVNVSGVRDSIYSGNAIGATGGLAGLGAQVLIFNDTSDLSAAIAGGAAVVQAQSVNILAQGGYALSGLASGGSVSAVAANGSVVHETATGKISASLGDGVQVGKAPTGTVGNLNLQSIDTAQATATTNSAAITVAGGSGADSQVALTPTLSATIGAGSAIAVTGNLYSQAYASQTVSAIAKGINAGALTIGVDNAATTVTAALTDSVGDAASITAGGNVTLQSQSQVKASSEGHASGGAAISGTGVQSTTTLSQTAQTTLGASVNLAAGGAVDINAHADSVDSTTSDDGGFAVAGVGNSASGLLKAEAATVSLGTASNVVAGGALSLSAGSINNFNDSANQVTTGASRVSATTGGLSTSASAVISRKANVTVGAQDYLRSKGDMSLAATASPQLALTSQSPVSGLGGKPTSANGTTTTLASGTVLVLDNANLQTPGTLSLGASGKENHSSAVNGGTVTVGGPVGLTQQDAAVVTAQVKTNPGVQMSAAVLGATVVAGYASNRTPEQLTKTQDLTLNGDIYAAGAQDRQLVINGDGSLSLRSNMDAQVTSDSVIVADLLPTVPQPLRVVLTNAGGTNGGTAVIHNNSVLSNVSISNLSSKNLVINTLSALVSQATPTLTLNGAASTVYAVASIPTSGRLTITGYGAGSITLQKNVTTLDDLTLTTVDNAAAGQDITVKAGAQVTANHIVVQAGDNVTMEAGSALISTSSLDIAGDVGNADVGVGTAMKLSDGALSAVGPINISGGTDADSIITGVGLRSTGGAVTVNGGDGNDALDVRGYAGTTTLRLMAGNGDDVITLGDIVDPVAGTRRLGSITGTVQVNPERGNDSLNLLDTGDALATIGTLSTTGLTGAGLGSGGVVTFNDVIETVTLSLGSGADTLQVLGTRAGTSTVINGGAGRDIVTVGSAALGANGTTGGIQGALAVLDSLGSAQLIVEDGGATSAQTTTIDTTTISGAGLGAVVTYAASATSRVDLLVNLGSGADTVTVLNTGGVLQVNGNGGDDNFALRAAGSGANPSFFGGTGNDTLTLSSAASGGTLTSLLAFVAFDGGAGNDALVIDDSAATVARNAHLTNNRVDIAALSAIYTGIESLKLAMGAGNDSVWVASTAAGTATSVLTGAGNDLVYAGSVGNALGNRGTLAGMAGALGIDGQAGTDTLFIDDTLDTDARTGTLTATGLQGLGMAGPGMNFAGVETLTSNLGSGANNLTLAGAGNVGNVAVDRSTTDTSAGSIFVMDDPFAATATGTLSSWQFFRNNALAAAPQQITPLLLKPGADGTWTVVAVGTTRTATTAGLQTYDFGLVSGSAQVAGLYFGWKDGSAGTGGNVGVPEWTDNTPGTNVVWLGAGQGALAVNNNYGVAGTFVRTYSVQAFATTTVAVPALQTTTINSGAGNDTFNVQATFGATTIHGGAGNDLFAVGSRTPGGRGNLNAIANTLTLDGGAGTDSVTLDDSSDVLANTGSLTSTKLSGMGMGDGVVYGAVESLTLTMGAGNDSFNVASTNAGTLTTLNGGPGDDTFTGALGGVIANPQVAAPALAPTATFAVASTEAATPSTVAASSALNSLVINGDAGTDTLLLDDSASQSATDFNVTATQITGTGIGAGGVNYQTVENLNLQPGSGGGNFNIVSSVAGSTITLKGTPGDDRKTLTPTTANIVYDAGQGNNVVTIAAPAPHSGPVGKITVLAGDGNNIIIGGSGDDTVIVGNGSNLIVGGGGNDTIKAGNGKNLIFGDLGSFKLDRYGRLTVAAEPSAIAGKDSIVVGNGNNIIFGGGGSDQITTGDGNNIVFGDFGRLVFDCGVLKQAVGQGDGGKEFGQKGSADTITTGSGNDLIFGGAGVDTIVPGGGKNKVFQDGFEVEGKELINWSGQFNDAAWMQSVSGAKLSPMLTNLKALASQLDPNRDLQVVL